jgi:NADH-quinone oxidoreductase subunit C
MTTATPNTPTLDHPTFQAVKKAFPNAKFKATEFRGQGTLIVEPKDLHAVLSFLKKDGSTQYDFLSDIIGIDYLGYPTAMPGRFAVVYALISLPKETRFFVKTYLDPTLPTDGIANDPALVLDSACSLWAGAEWMEREVFDMFGIRFANHPGPPPHPAVGGIPRPSAPQGLSSPRPRRARAVSRGRSHERVSARS